MKLAKGFSSFQDTFNSLIDKLTDNWIGIMTHMRLRDPN